MTRIDLDRPFAWLEAAKKRSALSLIVLAMVFINAAAGVVFLRQRFDKRSASRMSEPIGSVLPLGTGEGLDNNLTRSAVSGSNQLATNLVKPKLSGDVMGIINPDEAKKNKS